MMDINDIVDGLEVDPVVQINLDDIDGAAEADSKEITKNVTALFQDEEWMKKHPQVAARLSLEVEQLRRHTKMLRSDEQVHDALLMAISANSSNASLYKNLAVIQKTMLDVQTQLNETVKRINDLMKGFQLELNFESDSTPQPTSDSPNVTRGTKEFIKKMKGVE